MDENSNVMLEQLADEKCETLDAFFAGNDSLTQASQFKKILENEVNDEDMMMDDNDKKEEGSEDDMMNEEENDEINDDESDFNFNE